MISLAARMARRRISSMIAVALAILGGLTLVTATGVIVETGLSSHAPTGRLGGADIVVSAEQSMPTQEGLPVSFAERRRLPADLVTDLAALPGVSRAVGDVSFPAAAVSSAGDVVPSADPRTAGHGWASVDLIEKPGVVGSPPRSQNEVALGRTAAEAADVKPGDDVQITVAGEPAASFRVSAVVQGATDELFFADSAASGMAALTQGSSTAVDLIGIKAAPEAVESVATAIRDRTPNLSVSTGADRGDSGAPGTTAARGLLLLLAASLAGLILMIIGFVVAGACAVSLSGQQRELALLRAVGATPLQVRRLVAGQASVVALLVMAPGVALGYLLAGQLRDLLIQLGLLPAALPSTVSALPGLAAAALMLALVQLTTRAAAWRTSRMPATEAVAQSTSEPRTPNRLRALAGLLVIVAATVLSVTPIVVPTELGAAATSTAGILAAIGLAMAGPWTVSRVGRVFVARLPRRAAVSTWLAASNLRGHAQRFAGVMTALAMAVAFAITWGLSQTTVLSATSADARAATLAQHRIGADALGGVPRDLLAATKTSPGVQGAASVSGTSIVWPHRVFGDVESETESAIVLGPGAAGVLDLDVRAGDLDQLTGDTIAISGDVSQARDAPLGQTVNLLLGDGSPVQARVVAIYERGLGFGPVALSHDLVKGHTTSGLDQSILVRTDGTAASANALTALVEARPGIDLENTDAAPTAAPAGLWLNLAAISVILGYLLLSIANKIVAMTAQRAHEIATLRLIGATHRQIRAMVRREAAAVAGSATIAGLAVSALPLAFLSIGFLGTPWPAGPVLLLPVTVAVIVCLAFVTIEVPTRLALRKPPAEALRR
ncbi:integral membrane [Alloactinosynnema sp. L-07]|uniref:FtsX-like permease family protein n=1 Tax=Alloactinosynnema sp. L-07 TaxID=1653480 RepID=UPI00065EF57D|nr:FtsX-like permease family protein [Alloactinosynnema sp. L-07]CRK56615.1 integral membrane [Alloactinosynnema sp. L-07]